MFAASGMEISEDYYRRRLADEMGSVEMVGTYLDVEIDVCEGHFVIEL